MSTSRASRSWKRARRLDRDACADDLQVVAHHLIGVVLGPTVDEGPDPRCEAISRVAPQVIRIEQVSPQTGLLQKPDSRSAVAVSEVGRPEVAAGLSADLEGEALPGVHPHQTEREQERRARHRPLDPPRSRGMRSESPALRSQQKQENEEAHPEEAERHQNRHDRRECECPEHGIDGAQAVGRGPPQERESARDRCEERGAAAARPSSATPAGRSRRPLRPGPRRDRRASTRPSPSRSRNPASM